MGSVEELSLKAIMQRDLAVFMNELEFCSVHEIDGQEIPCVMSNVNAGRYVTDRSEHDVSSYGDVMSHVVTLWVKDEYVSRAEPGMAVKLDGRIYVITEALRMLNGIWRLKLGVSDA